MSKRRTAALRTVAVATLLAGVALPDAVRSQSATQPTTPSTIEPASLTTTAPAVSGFVDTAGVFGRVVGDSQPLSTVQIYAYQLADSSIQKVVTNDQGRFLFEKLPAGLYRFIAHKAGFIPAVVDLSRASAEAEQFLELQLFEAPVLETAGDDDFWSVRERIPGDVLRDIATSQAEAELSYDPGPRQQLNLGGLATRMTAMTGSDETTRLGEAQRTGGEVGVEGRVGNMILDVSGNYWTIEADQAERLQARSNGLPGATGKASARELNLSLEGMNDSTFLLTSRNNRLSGAQQTPVDLEHYRASWTQNTGTKGQTRVSAVYTEQSNYYRQSSVDPQTIPEASQSWSVEGVYSREASDQSSFETGLRYRDRTVAANLLSTVGSTGLLGEFEDERVELFGRGDLRLQPAVVVEYGLYTTLRDGSLSLTPRGGLVVQLNDTWQAAARGAHQIESSEDLVARPQDFVPSYFNETTGCGGQGDESCYELSLSHSDQDEEANTFSVGATHRQIGETLRLFFQDDFFDNVQSLYMVRGDELPGVQFAVSRRLSPRVLAKLESSLATGGGGIVYATDDEHYENEVRYLVTSLDTQFQQTATGLFIAFHHLEQELNPLFAGTRPSSTITALDSSRLQLMLTQDLNLLLDLAGDWAVKLDMELSQGLTPTERDPDELRTRVLGGIAVRF